MVADGGELPHAIVGVKRLDAIGPGEHGKLTGGGVVGVVEDEAARDVVDRGHATGVVINVFHPFAARIDDSGAASGEVVFIA